MQKIQKIQKKSKNQIKNFHSVKSEPRPTEAIKSTTMNTKSDIVHDKLTINQICMCYVHKIGMSLHRRRKKLAIQGREGGSKSKKSLEFKKSVRKKVT